ncbi:hypothetical protein [Legionella impletisoli]|uniref:Lipoprotein n=1 Tax=Legionella impletisoli TaxID=343510 RepID=A0A917NDP1_9GAMM|nr:hypothetical protein [Legionella impletisoli]GGI92111.1 hypothetical protein GCM10007966_21030 [Legionella impletisoli]
MKKLCFLLLSLPFLLLGCGVLPLDLGQNPRYQPLVGRCLAANNKLFVMKKNDNQYQLPRYLPSTKANDSEAQYLPVGSKLKIIKIYRTLSYSDVGPFMYLDMNVLNGPLKNNIITYQFKTPLSVVDNRIVEEIYEHSKVDPDQFEKHYLPIFEGKLHLTSCK